VNIIGKNTCILSYTSTGDVESAISRLQAQNFNLAAVSIIGNGCSQKEHTAGIYIKDKNIHFQGLQAIFWEKLWKQLKGKLFIELPGLGSLTAAGFIVQLLVKEHDEIDIHGFSALGTAFFIMGVPGESITQYEAAIKAGKILLIVNAARAEVERSCKILHSEKQQATVHLA